MRKIFANFGFNFLPGRNFRKKEQKSRKFQPLKYIIRRNFREFDFLAKVYPSKKFPLKGRKFFPLRYLKISYAYKYINNVNKSLTKQYSHLNE